MKNEIVAIPAPKTSYGDEFYRDISSCATRKLAESYLFSLESVALRVLEPSTISRFDILDDMTSR